MTNTEKFRNACEAATQVMAKINKDEFADWKSKLEYCIGSYDYDKNPSGLYEYGKVALGTDFPVEKVNPMLTFYAAVARKDVKGYPENGFQMKDALSREETLKGMTVWAAYSNFEEEEKGSIEPGKFADFVILDQNIMEIPADRIPDVKVLETYINGEKVN